MVQRMAPPKPSPIDQVAAIVEAAHWDRNHDRATRLLSKMDEAGDALLGRLMREWLLGDPKDSEDDMTGCVSMLVDVALFHIERTEDVVIVGKLRTAMSEELHPEQVRRMAWEEVDSWGCQDDPEHTAKILRSWGVEPTPEELAAIGGGQ